MRWFYLILIAAAVAGAALGVARLTDTRAATIEVIVAASLIIIFIALFGFLSKLRE